MEYDREQAAAGIITSGINDLFELMSAVACLSAEP